MGILTSKLNTKNKWYLYSGRVFTMISFLLQDKIKQIKINNKQLKIDTKERYNFLICYHKLHIYVGLLLWILSYPNGIV